VAESTEKRYSCELYNIQTNHLLTDTHTVIQAAPGKVSATADGWTANNTKESFLGVMAHWVEVKGRKWRLRSEVIGFQAVSGDHGGLNLGRYFIGLCDRVGITNKDTSKVTR
jgi:hypothetical protein